MYWLTLDPGLRTCGFAYWSGSALSHAGAAVGLPPPVSGPEAWLAVARATLQEAPFPIEDLDLLVVETMRIYTRGSSDPRDLLQLQGVAGTLTGLVAGLHRSRHAPSVTGTGPESLTTPNRLPHPPETGGARIRVGSGNGNPFPLRVEGLEPATWKGQVPRDVMGARQEAWVSAIDPDTGRDRWDRVIRPRSKTKLNDVMHAIGIGRYVIARRPDWLS